MVDIRRTNRSVSKISVHLVWVTKYRYHVLQGDIQQRTCELIIQIYNSEDIQILKGVVSKDHVHVHVEYPPSLSVSNLVKKLKSRTSRILQIEFPQLKQKYWGRHFWTVGYGAWSCGHITDEMVQEYLEHHCEKPNTEKGDWIFE